MRKVLIHIGGGKSIYVSLQDAVNKYDSELHFSWNEYQLWIDEGMNLSNDEDYKNYIKKLNLKKYDYKEVNNTYQDLKKSKFAEFLDDEILRFISHLYELGYFSRIGNPDLETWLNTKNVFQPNHDKISADEGYSLMDLIPLRNGINAFKNTLLLALKW
jgi:hypothetical protein